jgi:protein-S-isoprenylcysteine O-methyltransferase Ste14
MKKTLILLYGLIAYLFFLGTFSYAVCFIGGFFVPKTIDNGPRAPVAEAVVIDLLLLGLFAVQHSVMARQGFKRRWTQIVSWYAERSTYVVAATALLALVLWQWRPISNVVWDVRGGSTETLLRVLFCLGWGVLLLSTFLVNHFELFGLQQVWGQFRGREFHSPAFKTPGLYRLIRHPLYAGFLIGFWATPLMTAGHLLFAVACTGYILLGIYFEERDLIKAFGQDYRNYRHRVPMLIPFLKWTRGRSVPGHSAATRVPRVESSPE